MVNVSRDRYFTSDQLDRDEHDEYSDEYDVIKQFNEQSTHQQEIPYRRSACIAQQINASIDDLMDNYRSDMHWEVAPRAPRYRSPSPVNRDNRRHDRDAYRQTDRGRDTAPYRTRHTHTLERPCRSGQLYNLESSESGDWYSKPGKVQSGISAKPTSSVCEQMRYPHFSLGQEPGFIGVNIEFHQLMYEQFLAGELYTIMTTRNPTEREGRLELLQTISLWKHRWIMGSNKKYVCTHNT